MRTALGVCFHSQHLLPVPSTILSWPYTPDVPRLVTSRSYPRASWTGPKGVSMQGPRRSDCTQPLRMGWC